MLALPGAGSPARSEARPPDASLRPGRDLGTLPRLGVNLGGRSVWGAEQLMANVLRNPGFETALDGALVVVGALHDDTIDDDTPWTARPPGFWAGARFEVLSGAAVGARGRVLDSGTPAAGPSERRPDRLRLDPLPSGLQRGDVIALQGLQDRATLPQWWTQGEVQPVADARPGSPGAGAARLVARPGAPAALFHHLDSIADRAGKLLPVRGPWRLALWLRAEDAGARLRLSFGRQGRAAWLERRLEPGTQWQRVELPFDPVDDGPARPLTLALMVEGGTLRVDDVELGPDGPADRAAPGGFRREVVETLRALRPGYLRDWQGQLADSPANRSAAPFARRPIRYRPGAHELQFGYSLPEFLALAAAVGARPWVVLPAAATPDEARAFGEALAAGWRRHGFDEIVVEHGNEHWNATFRPAGIADADTLAAVAARAFAALREGAGASVPLHRVLGAPYGDGRPAARLAARATGLEGIAVAPYFLYRLEAGDDPDAVLERALREDVTPLQRAGQAAAAAGRALDVYEVNLHTTFGSASAAERAALLARPAATTALVRRMLLAMEHGVARQAVYALAGYDSFTTNGRRDLVPLFGITRDLAEAGHWRPSGLALQALNRVIAGAARQADCRGGACGDVTALAFDGGARWVLASAAARELRLVLACRGPLAVVGASEPAPDAGSRVRQATAPIACRDGQAVLDLPARSWIALAP